MTGQEMTELFFTKVKGWTEEYMDDDILWMNKDAQFVHLGGIAGTPELHTSLDLQEEWIWPELEGKIVSFEIVPRRKAKEEKRKWACYLYYQDECGKNYYAEGATPALAQLEASLKALGVL